MAALLIGYARCSTDQQDLTAQRDGLAALGVDVNRVYDPTDPVGRLLFNVLAMVAEFESDLIRRVRPDRPGRPAAVQRARDGCRVRV